MTNSANAERHSGGKSSLNGFGNASDQDNSGKLVQNWDGQQLQQDVEAQTKITEAFGKQAALGIGTYATAKLNDLNKQIADEPDPEKKAQLQNEAEHWQEGGAYRTALHAAAGALTGGLAGAAGATTSALAMPVIAEQIDKMDLPNGVKQGLAQVAAGALGVAVGGTAGVAASVNTEANNRQLHEDDKAKEKTLAKQLADKSNGQFTPEQIEDALRTANNNNLGEPASTGAVVPYDANAALHVYDGNGMILGRAPDGTYVLMQDPAMLVTPPSDLQAFIQNNTGNTYSWNASAPQLSGIPSSSLPSILNGTVTPEMLANRQNNAADFAGWMATQSGRFSSAATAYGAYLASQPNAVSQAGAAIQFGMAGTATTVGFGASALEQLLRPNAGSLAADVFFSGISEASNAIPGYGGVIAPIVNEANEVEKQSGWSTYFQNLINKGLGK